jgi:hypothetical protein
MGFHITSYCMNFLHIREISRLSLTIRDELNRPGMLHRSAFLPQPQCWDTLWLVKLPAFRPSPWRLFEDRSLYGDVNGRRGMTTSPMVRHMIRSETEQLRIGDRAHPHLPVKPTSTSSYVLTRQKAFPNSFFIFLFNGYTQGSIESTLSSHWIIDTNAAPKSTSCLHQIIVQSPTIKPTTPFTTL